MVLRKILSANKSYNSTLRYVFSAGEMLYGSDVDHFYNSHYKNAKLINLYGPTETTLAKFYYEVKINDSKKLRIPVGRPLDNSTFFKIKDQETGDFIDQELRDGEVVIITKYASAGYLNVGDETFIKLSNNNDAYLTGDRGELDNDGNLIIKGRLNGLIKINGQKVDCDLIAATMKFIPEIQDCCVIDIVLKNKSTILVAVYTKLNSIDMLDPSYLIQNLRQASCNIFPSKFVCLDKLPINRSGKIDKIKVRNIIENKFNDKIIKISTGG